MVNAPVVTDEVIAPVKIDENRLEGLDIMAGQIEDTKALNPPLKLIIVKYAIFGKRYHPNTESPSRGLALTGFRYFKQDNQACFLTSIPSCNRKDFLFKLFRQICFCKPPSPIFSDSRRLVHTAAIVKPHIILKRNDTGPGIASHHHRDKGLIQQVLGGMVVAHIVPCGLQFFLLNRIQPAHKSFVVVGSCVSYAILHIIMGKVVIGGTRIPGVKCEL